MKRLYFSARYKTIEADSNRCIGLPCGPFWSIAAGILELGLISTKPDMNCSPLNMFISVNNYHNIVQSTLYY
jgi:hypothetical protein